MDHNNILGVVLAGGQSKRFGQDKSQVRLQGTVMIDYILSEIIDEFPEILIVSNNDIEFKKAEHISKNRRLPKKCRTLRRSTNCNEMG